ncbi:MAG: S8 family serine peptidase [Saprospiraceae bacterium]|nr:S8 family serine peptidase [Saprospiraceae bacterium]
MTLRILVFSAIFLALQTTIIASDPSAKVDKSLLEKYRSTPSNEYLVLMKDRVVFSTTPDFLSKNEKGKFVYDALLSNANKTQRPVIEFLIINKIPFQSFIITNAIKVKSDYSTMMTLAARADVEQIIDNSPIKMLDYSITKNAESVRMPEPEWGIKTIKADSVWLLGYRGKGVVVGGQDTGYDWDVSPLKKQYRGYTDSLNVSHSYHWHDAIKKNNPKFPDSLLNPCGYSTKEPCDDNNHGTHTMGTMVGEDDNNKIGVSPESKWIACRNMDRGWGQPSTYIECFEWLLAPYDQNGKNADPARSPHVINNSWYCSTEEGCNPSNFKMMEEVVKNLKASGIVVVVSAGNSGSACGTVTGPPGFFEPSFSVGATDRNDLIAGFSSRGPVVIDSSFRIKPNVSAPGVGVRSVIRNGGFASFNGTSMAGPHVAGVVALMISANPSLAGKVNIIEDIIESTAVRRTSDQICNQIPGSQIPNPVYGYGRIDALAAVKKSLSLISSVIHTDDNNPLKILPNPAHQEIFISSENQIFLDEIHIFDIQGRLIERKIFSHPETLIKHNIEDYQSGFYVVRVLSAGKSYTAKFIKNP